MYCIPNFAKTDRRQWREHKTRSDQAADQFQSSDARSMMLDEPERATSRQQIQGAAISIIIFLSHLK
jgi:hypothetical protein